MWRSGICLIAWCRRVLGPNGRDLTGVVETSRASGAPIGEPMFGGLAPARINLPPTVLDDSSPPPLPPIAEARAALPLVGWPAHLVVPPLRELHGPTEPYAVEPAAAQPDPLSSIADAAAEDEPVACAATAEIVWLPVARPRLLAQQIASATRLNCPRSRAPSRGRRTSAVRSIPKRERSATRSSLKARTSSTGARVLRPRRHSAEIIRLDRRTTTQAPSTSCRAV